MPDHQPRQPRPVDVHNPLNPLNKIHRTSGESRRHYKHSLGGPLPGEDIAYLPSHKASADVRIRRTADRIGPALGLNANLFESDPIERDHAVDTGVTGIANPVAVCEDR